MNKDTIQGDWNIIKGKIKEKWGKITDDDLTEIYGKRDQLLGKIQKKYGLVKEKAEQELTEWEKQLDLRGRSGDQKREEREDQRPLKHTNKY